jgi:putative membrane protein
MRRESKVVLFLLGTFLGAFIWSLINPRDRFTWYLEVAPAVIGVVILTATYSRFRFTLLAYVLMWAHAMVLLVGGHYTYAEVPLFNWLRDAFELSRNHYDRVGHFAQGFVPAIVTRELLVRTSPVKSGGWLFIITAAIGLAISATYELFEWGVALATGSAADAFLGTQGDVWDTQSDMALALLGALVSLTTLGRAHDEMLKQVPRPQTRAQR